MSKESNEKIMQELSAIGQEADKIRVHNEERVDAWWDSLSQEEREDAFYSVVKRIYQGEVIERGTYRYVLYDVFGFDGGMYVPGMNCGFMHIHNCIFDATELSRMKHVNRFEVIDKTGRAYVKYLEKGEGIKYDLQDNDKTLKVFIDDLRWKEEL